MRRTVFLLLTLALLTVPVCAVQLPGELLDALPEEAAALAEGEGITEGVVRLLVQSFFDALRASLDRSLRGAVLLALTVLLTGAADGFASSLGENASRFVPLVGVLCVTTLSAGDLSSLIGLGTATMQDLADLTKLLLPTMAAALAGCGGVFTASAWQVGTLFAADALTTLIHELLLPLVYCHIALASAGAALPESGLDKLADGLKKLISWLLCGAVTAFTLYLSVSGVLTGSADRAAVKAAQTAVSGAVPVVGSILAESAEMVLRSPPRWCSAQPIRCARPSGRPACWACCSPASRRSCGWACSFCSTARRPSSRRSAASSRLSGCSSSSATPSPSSSA